MKIFQNETDEQKISNRLKDVDTELDHAGDLARKCLQYDDFKSYRKIYEKTESSLVDVLILYTKNFVESETGTIDKYAITVVRLITKLQNLRYLLKKIDSDSKRGLNNAKQEAQEI